MTDGAWEVVGEFSRKLPTEMTVGEALVAILRRRHKHGARKHIEQKWGLDPKTARNVVEENHVSERTLTKAAKAERWALWHALGEEMFGESYEDYLRGVIHEYEQQRQRAEARRNHVRDLEARASRLVNLLDRSAA